MSGIITIVFSVLFGRLVVRHMNDETGHNVVTCGAWRFWNEIDAGIFVTSSIRQRVEARRRLLPGIELRRVLHVKPAG